MTEDVRTIEETATIGQAFEIMENEGIRHLPVVRGRELVGMLSDRDLRSYGLSMVTDLEGVERAKARLGSKVATMMSANLITVTPDTDVAEIVDLMLEERIHAVPVIEEESNELVGIVTTVDMLGAVRDQLAAE
ncbi:MAG: CBS domain-containing protein [Sandaracinaceae bacterium]|nr:CBS domain-containing protein [Sandaracinaceae bacterium]